MTKRRTIVLGIAIACALLLAGYQWRRATNEYYQALEVERHEQWIASTIAALQQGDGSVYLYSCANTDSMLEALQGMPEVNGTGIGSKLLWRNGFGLGFAA